MLRAEVHVCVRMVVCTSTNRSSSIAHRSSSTATLSPQATSRQQRPGLPHRKDASGFQRAAAQGDGEHMSVCAALPGPHPGTLKGPQLGQVSLGASCCQMAMSPEPPQLQESKCSEGTRCLWCPLPIAVWPGEHSGQDWRVWGSSRDPQAADGF